LDFNMTFFFMVISFKPVEKNLKSTTINRIRQRLIYARFFH
jgi:hypothetical protein